MSKLMKTVGADVSTRMVKKELGVNYEVYQQIKEVQAMHGDIQARMPFKYSF